MESFTNISNNTELDSGTSSVCSEYLEEENEGVYNNTDKTAKKLITPDNLAISQLLNFDEDEDEDLSNSEDENEESENDDVANLTTENHKHERAEVNCENSETSSLQSPGGKDLLPNKDLFLITDKELSVQPGKLGSLSSKLSMSSCQDPGDQEQHKGKEGSKESESLKLEEAKHIQIVVSNARIETLPIDDNVRDAAKHGRVCFFCLKTKFWMFSRGVQCSMCCHLLCSKCSLSIRVPPCMTTSTASPHNSDQTFPPSHRDLSFPELEVSRICNTLTNTGPSKTSLASPGSGLASIQSVNPVTASVKSEDLARRTSRSTSSVDREGRGGSTLAVCSECKQMVQKVIQTSASHEWAVADF